MHGLIRRAAAKPYFRIAIIYQDGPTTSSAARFNIFPPITDQKARWQVDCVPGGSFEKESRQRLTTFTTVSIVVVADQHLLQGQGRQERGVDCLHHFLLLCPTGYVGLVRDTDQEKTSSLQ
jgi:hypothetical protein